MRILGKEIIPADWHEGHTSYLISAMLHFTEVEIATLEHLRDLKKSSKWEIRRHANIANDMIGALVQVHVVPEHAEMVKSFRVAEALKNWREGQLPFSTETGKENVSCGSEASSSSSGSSSPTT